MSTYDDLRHWERALLGGLLHAKPARQLAVVPALESEMFESAAHKAIAGAMRALVLDGVVPDLPAVQKRIARDTPENPLIHVQVLVDLWTDGLRGSNLEYYIEQLQQVRGRAVAAEYAECLRKAIGDEAEPSVLRELLDGIRSSLGGAEGPNRNG